MNPALFVRVPDPEKKWAKGLGNAATANSVSHVCESKREPRTAERNRPKQCLSNDRTMGRRPVGGLAFVGDTKSTRIEAENNWKRGADIHTQIVMPLSTGSPLP
jgi:hypothetical protein